MTRRTRKPARPAVPADRSLRYIAVNADEHGLLYFPRRKNGKRTFHQSRHMTKASIARMTRLLESMAVSVDLTYELIRLTYTPK